MTALNLIPGQLSLAQLRAIYQQPVTLSLDDSASAQIEASVACVEQILAIEYLLAAQAFEFLKEQRFGAGTDRAWRLLREVVPAYEQDRWLAPDIAAAAQLLKNTDLPNVHF